MSNNHSACTHHDTVGDALSNEFSYCPVMTGNRVSHAAALEAGLVRDHNGVRYYLCCAGCAPHFDAAPERYTLAS